MKETALKEAASFFSGKIKFHRTFHETACLVRIRMFIRQETRNKNKENILA